MSNTGDYPDFIRTVQSAAPEPFMAMPTGLRPSGSHDFGPFYMGEWSAVVANVLSNKPPQITLSWFADQAMAKPLGTQVITSVANIPIAECIPALGAWLLVSVIWDQTGVGAFASAFVTPRSDVHALARPIGNLSMLDGSTPVIAPAASFTDSAQAFVCSGPAKLTIEGGSDVWRAVLLAYTFGGLPFAAVGFIDGAAKPYGGMADVYLPLAPVFLQITNLGAVNQSFTYGLIMGNTF